MAANASRSPSSTPVTRSVSVRSDTGVPPPINCLAHGESPRTGKTLRLSRDLPYRHPSHPCQAGPMIETSTHGGVAVLTMRQGPVNALDLALLTALPQALAGAGDAPVVLTGAGRCFSAGVDLKRIVD